MPSSRGSFPHPVLDDSDDVLSLFVMRNGSIISGTNSLELQFDVELDDPEIEQFMRCGKARLGLRWKCASTLRLEEATPELIGDFGTYQRYRVMFSQEQVSGTIAAELVVVAATRIDDYKLTRQNPDYGDTAFLVQDGDLLATAGQMSFLVEKIYDPMLPPFDSCFQIREDVHLSSGIHVDTSATDYVIIGLAPDIFRNFQSLSSKPEYQLVAVMLPSLIATLTVLKQEDAEWDLQGKAWYRTLESLLEQYNVKDEEPYVQAQRILEDPIGGSIMAEVKVLGEEEQ